METVEKEDEENDFYKNAENYWAEIPATVQGMLGGFGHISRVDIQGSKQFLKHLFQLKKPPGKTYACDCGAGIGRITKYLLSNIFDKVDLVEQNSNFLDQAKEYLGPTVLSKIGEFNPCGLQNFSPEPNRYDIIWCQWVLGHLTEEDLIYFIQKCSESLRENGVIIIKENVTSSGAVEDDEKDSSVTRPFSMYMDIFKKANVNCFKKIKQTSFPKELYPVYMFALRKIT
ncbi:N-terminal Xaa-Pro-Lys N-methyltransferase 1 [Onthophagus taurus]|uniref:N-terminal Xaa-Pro-Lys N-methyltransferase 1 n=1 Tax=Onthophagus taurus TaxID=166361 RepID=UPI0039BE8CAE